MFILENEPLDLEELEKAVKELDNHWVGKYLVNLFVACYRGKKKQIDLSLFNSLDSGNKDLFIKIIRMRDFSGWNCEELYQSELRLKKMVGIR